MKAADGRKDAGELFTTSDTDSDDDDLSYTVMRKDPEVDDDDIHKSLSTYLKYIASNLMRLTGRQVCCNTNDCSCRGICHV